jgi:hypothetical protein
MSAPIVEPETVASLRAELAEAGWIVEWSASWDGSGSGLVVATPPRLPEDAPDDLFAEWVRHHHHAYGPDEREALRNLICWSIGASEEKVERAWTPDQRP